MNSKYKCNIDNIDSCLLVHRTSIEIINKQKNIKIGFLDIKSCSIINNKLVIKTDFMNDIIITSNTKKQIINKINTNLNHLRYDVKISDLIIDTDDEFICVIFLEDNTKNHDIVKLKCCNNLLHYNCYLNYLKTTTTKYKCPICRNIKCPLCLDKGC